MPNEVVDCLYSKNWTRVQPVCVNVLKNVSGRCRSSRAMSPVRPVASATRICVIQSGWAGQPGILMTGRPAFEVQSAPRKPPFARLWNCSPVEADGFGSMAGIPPQAAQSPMATTIDAALASSMTQSFMGRSANISTRPEPSGPSMTVPSKTKMSRPCSPLTQSRKIFWAFSPSSKPKEGCHNSSRPKSTIRSTTLGSSALRKDIVLPEQAPPWSHSTEDIVCLSSYLFPSGCCALSSDPNPRVVAF